jgi:hypothetical protein
MMVVKMTMLLLLLMMMKMMKMLSLLRQQRQLPGPVSVCGGTEWSAGCERTAASGGCRAVAA